MRIALCDDNEGFRELLDVVIGDDPQLELVCSAPALTPLLDALPDLEVEGVLLDWLMPDADQEEGVRRVREALPGARIVVLSAVVRASAEDRALAAGADGYVEKGPGGRELLERCKRILLP
ncbi:MAG: response regulator receiver protein [Solirubrobacterales bacterium]|nr:response regulator receiver protein [Solirubrobacterales bacterium]